MRQAAKAASFQEASEDLKALADVSVSATHLQRLSERVGQEWAQARAQEVQAFREEKLVCPYAAAPKAAAVMVDGGRLQTRLLTGKDVPEEVLAGALPESSDAGEAV